MAINIYTIRGASLTSERERAITRLLFGQSNEVVQDMTVEPGTGGFLVSRTSGTVQIQGVLISDDQILADWKDLDIIEPDDSDDRRYLAYVLFNPLTDTAPTYNIISFNDPSLITIFTSPNVVVMCVIVLPVGSTSSADATYARPDTTLSRDRLVRSAIDQTVLEMDVVSFDEASPGAEGSGTNKLRWRAMKVFGERLGVRYDVISSVNTDPDPFGGNYEQELDFPNWGRGFFFVRAPIDVDGVLATVNTNLHFAGFQNSSGDIQADSSWYGQEAAYSLGDEDYPQRPQRHDIKIVGTLANGVIKWVNGSVTYLGGVSAPGVGDTHNILEIYATGYGGASATVDLTSGRLELDGVMNNLSQLAQFSLDAAYDGDGTPGSGRVIEADVGPVQVDIYQPDETNPWRAGVNVNQNVGDENYLPGFEAAFDAVDQLVGATGVEKNHALRHRRVYSPAWGAVLSKNCTLHYDSGAGQIEFVLTDGGAPGVPEFLAKQAEGARLMVVFEGMSPGLEAEGLVFELIPLQVFGITVLERPDLSGFKNFPSLGPDLFGTMASDINCQATIWEVTAEIGGDISRIAANLIVGKDLDVRGDAQIGGTLDVGGIDVGTIAGAPTSTLGATTAASLQVADTMEAGDVAGVKTLSVTDTAMTVQRALTVNAATVVNAALSANSVASTGAVQALNKSSFTLASTQTIVRAVPIAIIEQGSGWSVDVSGAKFIAAKPGVDYMTVMFSVPQGATVTQVSARMRTPDVDPSAFSMSLIKHSKGTGPDLTTTAVIGSTSPTPNTLAADINLAVSNLCAEGDVYLVRFDGRNIELSTCLQVTYTTGIVAP